SIISYNNLHLLLPTKTIYLPLRAKVSRALGYFYLLTIAIHLLPFLNLQKLFCVHMYLQSLLWKYRIVYPLYKNDDLNYLRLQAHSNATSKSLSHWHSTSLRLLWYHCNLSMKLEKRTNE